MLEEELYKIIGKNIRKFRLENGLSIEDLCWKVLLEHQINFTKAEIIDLENGQLIIEVGTILVLSQALDQELGCFFE